VAKKLPIKKVGPKAAKKVEKEEAPAVSSGEVAPGDTALEGADLLESATEGTEKKDVKKGKPAKGLASKARAKSAAQESAKKEKKVASVRPLRGGISFICSECYEDFVLPATYSRDTVTCPECMHVGKRPAEDFLRTVNLHKSGEQKELSSAIGISMMLAVWVLVFLWAVSPYPMPETLTKFMDLGQANIAKIAAGLAGLFAILLMVKVSKYEKNRWEIYF
jgi:hypothetical protein